MSSFASYDSSYGGNFIFLSAGSGTTIGPIQTDTSQNVTGFISATVSGVGILQQSMNGGRSWDITNTIYVTSGTYTFNYPVLGNWAQLVYTNGGNGTSGYFKAYLQSRTTGIV